MIAAFGETRATRTRPTSEGRAVRETKARCVGLFLAGLFLADSVIAAVGHIDCSACSLRTRSLPPSVTSAARPWPIRFLVQHSVSTRFFGNGRGLWRHRLNDPLQVVNGRELHDDLALVAAQLYLHLGLE